jgi:predicted  nucleic acid-binding Zn-ribbon protein
MPDSPLETLLVVQDHDLAADRLRHRRAHLTERADLTSAEGRVADTDARTAQLDASRTDVDGQERRLGDEVASVNTKASDVERTMYSGEISSPRELQALQADVEQLRRQQGLLEDRELELMEAREELDTQLTALSAAHTDAEAEAERLRGVIAGLEAEIDAELAAEADARSVAVALLPADVVATYEEIRAKGNGAGAARLIGMTCQSCHLTIPSTEVDRMRRAAHRGDLSAAMSFCDNCGAILVLTERSEAE